MFEESNGAYFFYQLQCKTYMKAIYSCYQLLQVARALRVLNTLSADTKPNFSMSEQRLISQSAA